MVEFKNGVTPINDVNLNKIQTDLQNQVNEVKQNYQELTRKATQIVFEKTFSENTSDFVIDFAKEGITFSEGDILEITFHGAIQSTSGNVVAQLMAFPNGKNQTYTLYRASFYENNGQTPGISHSSNTNVAPPTYGLKFVKGYPNYRTIAKIMIEFQNKYITSMTNFISFQGGNDSKIGQMGTMLGEFDSITSLVIGGQSGEKIAANSRIKIVKI